MKYFNFTSKFCTDQIPIDETGERKFTDELIIYVHNTFNIMILSICKCTWKSVEKYKILLAVKLTEIFASQIHFILFYNSK